MVTVAMLGVLLATVALVGECSIPSCKTPRVSDTDCWVSRGYLSKAPEVIYILATRPTGASTPGEPQMGRTDVRRGLVILALVAAGCACSTSRGYAGFDARGPRGDNRSCLRGLADLTWRAGIYDSADYDEVVSLLAEMNSTSDASFGIQNWNG